MSSIRNRLLVILALVVVAGLFLKPGDVKIREQGPDGRMRDTTVTRVPLKLGLDLQGGMHLALEIDESQGPVRDPEDAINRALSVIRNRIDEFGVAEPLIQKVGAERIVVELAGIDDPARARGIVERSAFLEWRMTDKDDRFFSALPAVDAALLRAGVRPRQETAPSALEQLLGTDTTAADTAAADTAATPNQPGPLSTILSTRPGGAPGEFLVPEEDFPWADSLLALDVAQRALSRSIDLFWGSEPISLGARSYRPLYSVERRVVLTGQELTNAQATIDQSNNQRIVRFDLSRTGGRRFRSETRQHIGDHMAIILDNRVFRDPPVIRSEIGRRGQIELGSATIQEAEDLALVLRAGALPAPLQIVEERSVGPSLGRDSVSQGQRAGVMAVVLVVLLMAFYYRLTGMLAIAALSFYVLFTLGGLAMLGATLTLPGLAGLVLSLGLAVDANVLIFERIREEVKLSKTPRLAVDSGFQHAMPAIIDANVTTVISAAFLFRFGTGPVKGFAATLIIGIIASLITAVFVTKTFFLIWLQRRDVAKGLSI